MISSFFHKNIDCWYSSELPRWGDSNEYQQHMFLWRNMENYPEIVIKYPPYLFLWIVTTSHCLWTAVRQIHANQEKNDSPTVLTLDVSLLKYESTHEIMALIALHKLNLQTRMRSIPLGLYVWFFVRPFVYFHTLCVQTVKALVMRGCAVLPELSLFAYAVSTIISWAGTYMKLSLKLMLYWLHYYYIIYFSKCDSMFKSRRKWHQWP